MTPMITCIEWRARNNRATRNTLNVLKILIVLKADKDVPPELILISTIERSTTTPSIRFIRSAQYLLIPMARSFIDISTIKIQVNSSLISSRNFASDSGIPYLSIARAIVFRSTAKVIKFSKNPDLTNIRRVNLAFLRVPALPLGQTRNLLKKPVTHSDYSWLRLVSRISCPLQRGLLHFLLLSSSLIYW